MPWTDEQKLSYLLRLPWSLIVEEGDEPGEKLLRAGEIPSACGSGTEDEVVDDFWESLRSALEARLHFGDPIPLPPGVDSLPWDRGDQPAQAEKPDARVVFRWRAVAAGAEEMPATASEHPREFANA